MARPKKTDPDFQHIDSYLTRCLTDMKHLHEISECSGILDPHEYALLQKVPASDAIVERSF